VIGQIGNRQPRGDEAKAPVEAGQLAQQRRRAWARWAGWLPALGHRPFERKPLFDLIASRRPHRIQQYLGSCQH
jgi:hypothetical protein